VAGSKPASRTGGRPSIAPVKYATFCRLAEHLASRVPHLHEMESGEAYLCLCNALKDSIADAFGGPNENLFILETYRQMVPKYADFEPWHHSEREKRKASAEGPLPEGVFRCERCVHTNTIHGYGACAFVPCDCPAFAGPLDAGPPVAAVGSPASSGPGWDGG
jgi:hypothetical protein